VFGNISKTPEPPTIGYCLNGVVDNSVERHLRFPNFPNLADQVWTRLQGDFSRSPPGWRSFSAFALPDQLEGLHLPDGFLNISPYWRSKYLITLHYTLGIDDEPSASLDTGIFIEHTEDLPNLPTGIRLHRKRNTTLHHPGKLIVVPHLMNEDAIDAH
jgi:hypothetical protein